MSKTILIVEDESDIRDMLRLRLKKEGFEVLTADNGQHALGVFDEGRPDLVILDLMLPFLGGMEVLRAIRKTQQTPVLILSAKGEESDVIVGLELGADDYVVKPFSMPVLVARIHALLRRGQDSSSESEEKTGVIGPLRIDRKRFEAKLDDRPLHLTRTEFLLLATLVEAQGRVLTRNQLIDRAMGAETIVTDRTVDVHLTSLRGKLGTARDLIETVRGVGYRMRHD